MNKAIGLEKAKKDILKIIQEEAEKKIQEKKEIKKLIAKKGRKRFIEDSIVAFRSWHNQEYLDHIKYIYKLRKIQANKYASTPNKEFRLLLKLPTRLYIYLNRFLDPRFPLDDKEAKWFARKYKEFVVAEKI